MDQNHKYEHDDTPEFLQVLKDKTAMKVPTNYFAEMQSSVLDKVVPENNQAAIRHRTAWDDLLDRLEQFSWPHYTFAAIATVLMLGLFLFPSSEIDSADAFADLSETDLEYFLNNEIDNVDGEELIAILSTEESDLSFIPIQETAIDFPENIAEEYMIDIDESTLIDFSEE